MNGDIELVIDGGMHTATIREVLMLGADSCVICSAIVHAENVYEQVQELKRLFVSLSRYDLER